MAASLCYSEETSLTYAYLRDDLKIKFRMVSEQHFINEAPDLSFRVFLRFLSSTDLCSG